MDTSPRSDRFAPAVAPDLSRDRGAAAPVAWLVIVVLLIAAGIGAWWVLGRSTNPLAPRADQNVLLISIDSLRADVLSSYGGAVSTPVLDDLARRGIRFTFAHSNAVTTLPSHASLLSGLLPPRHGIRANMGYELAPGTTLLAERMRAEGFSTGAFIGSGRLTARSGLGAGFDIYDDHMSWLPDPIDLRVPERAAGPVVQAALNWQSMQTGRWFAFVQLAEPAAPYAPPDNTRSPYPSDPYFGEVAAADAALGPLIERLAEDTRPTLVIVTSDHGEGLGEHSEETHGLFAYETTLRVPIIVARIEPGGAASGGGSAADVPVQSVDIVPTILDAIEAAPDPALPGRPLSALVANGDDGRAIYFEALSANILRGWAPLRGVLQGRTKFIDLPVPELYDLGADPGEMRNLASVQPERQAELAATLATFDTAAPAPTAAAATERLDRLRSLGYLTLGRRPASPTEADDPKRLVEFDRVMDAAQLAFEDGFYEDAAAALQQVIVERPGNAEAYRALAVVFWHGGLPDQAIATLQAALHVGLPQGGIAVMLGRMLSMTAAASRTVALLEEQTGDDLLAIEALGIAYSQIGRAGDAEAAFGRMLEIDPASGRAHQNLGILQLRLEQYANAEASLRQALRVEPALSTAYTPLGVAVSEQGRFDEAIEAWRQAVALDDAEYLALFNLTLALFSQDRLDEAHLAGEQFLRTAPPAIYSVQLAQIRALLEGG